MEIAGLSLTTITLFLPLIGFIVLLLLPAKAESDEETANKVDRLKWVAFGFTLLTFILSLIMWGSFDASNPGLQMVQANEWLNLSIADFSVTINYYVGVDGISLLLILLTTFIVPISVLASMKSNMIASRGREKLFYAFLLLLEFAMLGVFMVQDLIVFYIFWELTLIPMYFLIGIWGGDQRVYASVKFFLYTMAGSLLMLIAIIYVGNYTGTFTLPGILEVVRQPGFSWVSDTTPAGLTPAVLFFFFFIAFAIKVPIFPFHSWLPDAHVQAPTAGSIILAGVLLKMGTYGLIRFNLQLFPEQSIEWAPLIGTLAVIGIIYGAWVSYAQKDVKKLVAYTSVSHLGFVVLGIFALNAQGIQGATLQMVNHGISTGALFLIVGTLYERYHTKEMKAYGGLWRIMPLFGGLSLIVVLSSMGLPGLNGFVGEFTILMGSLGSEYYSFTYTLFATTGVILAAIYMLQFFQHVFMGDYKEPHDGTASLKLKWTEWAALVPLLVMIFWIGLQPAAFFHVMDASVNQLLVHLGDVATTVASLIH